jgi:hypothetical protein
LDAAENEVKQIELASFANGKPFAIFAAIYYTIFAAGKYLTLRLQ